MKRLVLALPIAVALGGLALADSGSGTNAYSRGEFAAAFAWYNKAAAQGNAVAQFNLGRYLEQGEEVARDLAKAVNWYEQAAAQGHDGARRRLAALTGGGAGAGEKLAGARRQETPTVGRNGKAAAFNRADRERQTKLLEATLVTVETIEDNILWQADGPGASAQLAQATANANDPLVRILQDLKRPTVKADPADGTTTGEAQDVAEADAGVTSAAALPTNADADYAVGFAAYVRGDYVAALKTWQPLAELGHAGAQRNLGVMYEKGRGVPLDPVSAARWYRAAAEQGQASAQFNLALMYSEARGVTRIPAEAARWFRAAAEQNNVRAQFEMARLYELGEGVPLDIAEAADWLRRAADQGLPDAQFRLGQMYREGRGVARDENKARRWLGLAAQQGFADRGRGSPGPAAAATTGEAASLNRGDSAQPVASGARGASGAPRALFRRPAAVDGGTENEPVARADVLAANDTPVTAAREPAPPSGDRIAARPVPDTPDPPAAPSPSAVARTEVADQGSEDATTAEKASQVVARGVGRISREVVPGNREPAVENARVRPRPDGARSADAFGRPLPRPDVPRRGAAEPQQRQSPQEPVVAARAVEPPRADSKARAGVAAKKVAPPVITVKPAAGRVPDKAQTEETGRASVDLASVVNRPVESANDNGFELGLDAYTNGAYEAAMAAWQVLGDRGDPKALFGMGLLFHNGLGVGQDFAQAAKLFRQAADQGYAEAQYNLSLLYTRGQGVRQDYGEAVKWVRRATEQGIAAEPAKLTLLYHVGKDLPPPESGAGALVQRLLAFASRRPAQYQKGLAAYADGDYAAALALWRPLAERGMGQAQFALATAYALGRGVPQSEQKAVEWLTQAAEKKVADAQYNLGVRFALGQGVPQDSEQAVAWYSLAAARNVAEAQLNLGIANAQGDGVEQNERAALSWFERAAEGGIAEAMYNAGVMYANGLGTAQSLENAARWYKKAAEQGYAEAQLSLGILYVRGQGIEQSYEEAATWFRRAADQGVAAAQFNIAVMYEFGNGLLEDDARAHLWFTIAAQQGYNRAKERRTLLALRMSEAQLARAEEMSLRLRSDQ